MCIIKLAVGASCEKTGVLPPSGRCPKRWQNGSGQENWRINMKQRVASTPSLIYSFFLRVLASPVFFVGWVLLAIISQSDPSVLFVLICLAPFFFLSLIMLRRKDMRTTIQRVTDEIGQPSLRDFIALIKLAQRLNRYTIPSAFSQSGACGRDLSKMKSNNNTRTGAASISARQKSGGRGDGDSDGDGDGEPPRSLNLHLYDEHAIAQCFRISKKTVQNTFSKSPNLFPPSIKIPGARGPRWTARSIEEWINNLEYKAISAHAAQQINSTPRRPGRPRIAQAGGVK